MKISDVTKGAVVYKQSHVKDYKSSKKTGDWLVICSKDTNWLQFQEGMEEPVQGDHGTGVLARRVTNSVYKDECPPYVYTRQELMTRDVYNAKCAKIDVNRIDIDEYVKTSREKGVKFKKKINTQKAMQRLFVACEAVVASHQLPTAKSVELQLGKVEIQDGDLIFISFVFLEFTVRIEHGLLVWDFSLDEHQTSFGLPHYGFGGVAQITACVAALERMWRSLYICCG